MPVNNKAKLDSQTSVMQQVSLLTSMGLIFMSLGITFGMIGMLSIPLVPQDAKF